MCACVRIWNVKYFICSLNWTDRDAAVHCWKRFMNTLLFSWRILVNHLSKPYDHQTWSLICKYVFCGLNYAWTSTNVLQYILIHYTLTRQQYVFIVFDAIMGIICRPANSFRILVNFMTGKQTFANSESNDEYLWKCARCLISASRE